MMKKITMGAALLSAIALSVCNLTGCSMLQGLTQSADDFVSTYCSLPIGERELSLGDNAIHIHCDGEELDHHCPIPEKLGVSSL